MDPATPVRNYAVVVPMANEEKEFFSFIRALSAALDAFPGGTAYLVIDRVSKDDTLVLARELAGRDPRFRTIWAPENRHLVDAYLRGYREALYRGHPVIIEMDAGLSHDPASLGLFLERLAEGYECVYGSRFIRGGGIVDSNTYRTILSKFGTILANLLLGTRLHDMTSGYQGFTAAVVKLFVDYDMLSSGHFYQTEIRYLLRKRKSVEVPITYRAPSPGVSGRSLSNAWCCLWHYFFLRIAGRPVSL